MKTKVKSLVNLNTNPCKMCMPMGASMAFYGLKECMTILHGSQGCSTYIRRHMATHFNEPVDIASSSLTEHGTVYGGEKNLKQGLVNLVKLYEPKIVGIMTTCLAETIGEDVPGIVDRFYEEYPEYKDLVIIPVNSPGYGGTQFEGYLAAVRAMVSRLELNEERNDKINVILPPQSPADIRFIKSAFEMFGLEGIFLPDISENLDGGHKKEYSRLPKGGTSYEELLQMGGAKITIEITDSAQVETPGKVLFEKYGVPYKQISSPVGLEATDAFYQLLSDLSGKEIPDKILEERSRYLDAMIDSHKYNSAGRAVVFGEPEFIISTVKLCSENGIMPVVVATGSVFKKLKSYVGDEIEDLSKRYFVDDFVIMDDADFKEIEEAAVKYGANLMIGNSDGRRIEEDLDIPLIRRAFPIHDQIGGQRLRMLGYEGSLTLLDEMTNALLSVTETTFREKIYDDFYKDSAIDQNKKSTSLEEVATQRRNEIQRKTLEHPCYNCAGHKFARIHLPVAPACNIQCSYCVRKFDCANESRPGVTSTILTPEEALARYIEVKKKMPNLTVVGIAGPGDALANSYPEVRKTLELIREYDPKVTFCLSTNGLMLPHYAQELVDLGVSHVTVTMNAVDPKIAGQIYKYINYMGKKYTGETAGAIMVSNQMSGLRILVANGIMCKVNIVTLRGINEDHIPEVVQACKDIGCFMTNIMQMIPVKGSDFENLPMVSEKEIKVIRDKSNKIMKQMYHCKQCRADAIGTLNDDKSVDLKGFLAEEPVDTEKSMEKKKLQYAVASKSGMNVDMHFGQAEEFYIYEYLNGEVRFKEKRNIEKFCAGNGDHSDADDKISKILSVIDDCDGVVSMRIGESPKVRLREKGYQVVSTFDQIENAIISASKSK